MGTVWLASLTPAVMWASDVIFVSLLFLLPSSTPLSCLIPCQPGQESTEELPCNICPELDANDCQSKELVVGPCGCQECAKAVGEECGGPWEAFGQCAGSFTCIKHDEEEEWAMDVRGNMLLSSKKFGGIEYRLARLANTAVPSQCLSSCIYSGESGREFCFQAPFLSSVLASETIAINNNY